MPMYDYACTECLHLIEDVFEKSSEPDVKECPECKKLKLTRLAGVNTFKITGYNCQNGYTKGF